MSEWWQPILICMGGTQEFRANAATLLPLEPKEDEDSWKRRVSHAVLSPFLTRLAEQAAGLICRKPITLEPQEEGGEVDPYWEDFIANVDGYGANLDAYARRLVLNSILMGHSATLVDYPATEAAANLREERLAGLRPYFIEVRADQILGFRKSEGSPLAPVEQIRISEYVTEKVGMFGDEIIRQIRVLEPGGWSTWRKGEKGWQLYQEGSTSLDFIPLAPTYSNKLSELVSKPPLLPIANLNILHAQRLADLQFSIHVASMPILVMRGFDDNDSELGLSAASAILMPIEGGAEYVEPASSSFDSQQNFLTELENQMRSLGISTLFQQTFVGETAEAKAMDRSDSDSLLSVVAQDLEESLQHAFEIAAEFVGIEPPKVCVARDFNLQSLSPQQVQQYVSLWSQGAIQHSTLLEMLQRGEILPDLDVEAEIEMIEQTKLADLDMAAAGGFPTDEDDPDAPVADGEDEQSELRKEVIRRLKQQAEREDEDEKEDE